MLQHLFSSIIHYLSLSDEHLGNLQFKTNFDCLKFFVLFITFITFSSSLIECNSILEINAVLFMASKGLQTIKHFSMFVFNISIAIYIGLLILSIFFQT